MLEAENYTSDFFQTEEIQNDDIEIVNHELFESYLKREKNYTRN